MAVSGMEKIKQRNETGRVSSECSSDVILEQSSKGGSKGVGRP